jgi:hypothetical protein
MVEHRHESEREAAADDLADSLVHKDRRASVHLARLLLADESAEGGVFRPFARTLARQLRRWSGTIQAIEEGDVEKMLRVAAREIVGEMWDE